MRTSTTATALLGGLALVGALAGCSTPAATTDTGSGTDSGSGSSTDSGSSSGSYKDGTYTESADYQAPSGTETVDVTLTLADNVITAVEVTGHATDPQAKQHQGEFKDGIAGVVVGKNLDEIKVDRVGGSSLTSGGFNKAVELIKADAGA
ncbi:MAG: FMN-binding protein [Actinobacteria bacterium]|nr:FMN-binding protein [Actinomycetota bacterium]